VGDVVYTFCFKKRFGKAGEKVDLTHHHLPHTTTTFHILSIIHNKK
jgi:hypothetical protein